jgi:glycosyltransferase involved in cell wall biosynthesis
MAPLRVLHLYSDRRWTGPAEPVVNLCLALRARGIDARLACRAAQPGAPQSIEASARERGLEPLTRFRLNRYFNLLDNLADLRAIRAYVRAERIDLLHVHLSHDHLLGAAAVRGTGVPVVRTNHKGVPLGTGRPARMLLSRFTSGYLSFSRRALAEDVRLVPALEGRSEVVNPAVDLRRFDPAGVRPGARARLGIPEDAPLGCIVARMQRHRRFDVLLRAVRIVADRMPSFRFLVVGRGTHQERVARAPARALGLDGVVAFAGYRSDDYVDTLAAADFKVFLVPGSDGTCRAAREMMALGKPVIASRRGMLPEIVADGENGLLVDDTEEPLAAAMLRLARDRDLCRRLGARARETAVREFSLPRQAERVAAFYRRLQRDRAF